VKKSYVRARNGGLFYALTAGGARNNNEEEVSAETNTGW